MKLFLRMIIITVILFSAIALPSEITSSAAATSTPTVITPTVSTAQASENAALLKQSSQGSQNLSAAIAPTLSSKNVSSNLISLNFSNIKVRELLQIIAQFTGLNFVIDDSVNGDISIHLRQVPWTQALNVILKSQDLGERQAGKVIYIAPLSDLLNQQISELEANQKMRDLVPLVDKVIRLKYTNAADVIDILSTKNNGATSSLISSRGSISADKRTNSIWVRDTPRHVRTISHIISQLDHPVKQVMIEARIISIDKKYERTIGARFGLSKPSQLSGTLEGANTLQANGGNVGAVPLAQRLNFNGPATTSLFAPVASPGIGQAGSIGIAVAKLGSTFIDMELSALEEQNELDIISSPRLITSNQQAAYIETGEQIPYQSATASGATAVSFVNAVLKLQVTPQITPDNHVILNLTVTNDSAGQTVQLSGGGSAIPINTEEEQSLVLLNNNQTVVLGGVYQRTKGNVYSRVPFLSKIPLLGNLFKEKDKYTEDNELLIFLTPHIIQKPADISSSY